MVFFSKAHQKTSGRLQTYDFENYEVFRKHTCKHRTHRSDCFCRKAWTTWHLQRQRILMSLAMLQLGFNPRVPFLISASLIAASSISDICKFVMNRNPFSTLTYSHTSGGGKGSLPKRIRGNIVPWIVYIIKIKMWQLWRMTYTRSFEDHRIRSANTSSDMNGIKKNKFQYPSYSVRFISKKILDCASIQASAIVLWAPTATKETAGLQCDLATFCNLEFQS